MKVRKWVRIIHRDLGYIFFGMTIIYGLSGIALNHLDNWNPNYIVKSDKITLPGTLSGDSLNQKEIISILKGIDNKLDYKSHYYPNNQVVKIFIKQGSLTLDLSSNSGILETIRRRPVFREINFLHYNNPKKIWTWYSDLFAVSLVLLAITGLFMIKGRKGITGRGAWLTVVGIIIPLLLLILYF